MSDLQQKVTQLLDKAVSAEKSEDALRLTQAALNAAHTKHALAELIQPKG